MTLETGREEGFSEFPSPDRLTVGTSNRLRVIPRYCGRANPLGCGDRYGDVVCNVDVRETLWWLGELAGEAGVLAGCCISQYLFLVVVGVRAAEAGRSPPDQKAAIILPLRIPPAYTFARSCRCFHRRHKRWTRQLSLDTQSGNTMFHPMSNFLPSALSCR